LWISDPDFNTKILPYSAINLSKRSYEMFYQRIFNLSRDIIQGFEIAESNFKPIRIPRESISIEDLRLHVFLNTQNLAIPEEMVLSRSSSFLLDYENYEPPNPVLKREIGVREILTLGPKVLIGNSIETDAPGDLSGAQVNELPRLRKEFFSVKSEINQDEVLNSSLQFNTNPNIPLMEFIRKYDYLPTSIQKWRDVSERRRDWRLNSFNIKNLRDLRWCLSMMDIIPDYEIDEALEELRLLQDNKEDCKSDLDRTDNNICEPHLISPKAGVDNELEHINIVSEDCNVCVTLSSYFRSKILSTTDEDPDKRANYMALLPRLRDKCIEILLSLGHDPEEIWALKDQSIDLFDQDTEASDDEGGVFSMFD